MDLIVFPQSSTFTSKVRLALQLKQIPYFFVEVPSMIPRPILKEAFNLTYRKIPVCAIGRDIFCDTSIILEALEHQFPESKGFPSLYPKTADGRSNRSLIRGFASYWTDRPFFRVTTGLIPASVWRTDFGKDRARLIGHKLDADKLEKKVPNNLSNLDLHLSLFEDLFTDADGGWIFSTPRPSAADIALWYQLNWGMDISAGKGIYNLTGGGTMNTAEEGAKSVFNESRYPKTWQWFEKFRAYMDNLPVTEKLVSAAEAIENLKSSAEAVAVMLPTPAAAHAALDGQNGLLVGALVSVAPDDTGRNE